MPHIDRTEKYIGINIWIIDLKSMYIKKKDSSITLHKHEKNEINEFQFNETKILSRDDNYHEISIKEIIDVKKCLDLVNDKVDMKNLCQMY